MIFFENLARRWRHPWLVGLGAILLISQAMCAETKPSGRPDGPEGPAVGMQAPSFQGMDVNGKRVTLSDFAGKAVALDFWAEWCHPCMELMPHAEKIARSLRGKDAILIGYCAFGSQATFEKWVRDNQARFPNILFLRDASGLDRSARVESTYGISRIPVVYIIGPDGRIRDRLATVADAEGCLEAALIAASHETARPGG